MILRRRETAMPLVLLRSPHVAALARPVSPTIGGPAMSNDLEPLSRDQITAIARRIERPVVLVGMMGVGKNTVGKRLAHRLGVS